MSLYADTTALISSGAVVELSLHEGENIVHESRFDGFKVHQPRPTRRQYKLFFDPGRNEGRGGEARREIGPRFIKEGLD